ncbi:MAG: hypothetical protein S4CHLAM81_12160 [Chlamydiales bacterium]|nr:hypothetical protein [Chlamydiales bacterium]MCH9635992.1 hypothetical protein [Chlamydiales bacterium]MCH9703763.1 EscU/YscU/HrcU family type III secretion system export apparatus switch protein [Chlamydiota bacterium]
MQEKEFDPSRKKLLKARKKGQVVRSTELASALLLLLFFILLRLIGPKLYSALKTLFSFQIMDGFSNERLLPTLWPVITIMLILFLCSYLFHFIQTGFLFSWPKRGKKKLRLFFPLLKLVGLLGIFTILYRIEPKERTATSIFSTLYRGGFFFALYLVILGIFDYFYQKWIFMSQMRMTRQEKQEETRED